MLAVALYTAEARTAAVENYRDRLMESCMGWDAGSAHSEGKPETASEEEKKTAKDACRQKNCEWICAVPVESLHEKYHPWFDKNHRMHGAVVTARFVAGTVITETQQGDILGEIGGNDAEARYLRERLEEAEKKGECSKVQGTINAAERDRRIREAYDRVKKYLESLENQP